MPQQNVTTMKTSNSFLNQDNSLLRVLRRPTAYTIHAKIAVGVCIYNMFIIQHSSIIIVCFDDDNDNACDVQLPSARFMLLVYNNYAIIEYFTGE